MAPHFFRLSSDFSRYLFQIHTLQSSPWNWLLFFTYGLCTTLPLIVGGLSHHMAFSIFGSLMTFLILINDSAQDPILPLRQRWQVVFITFILILLGSIGGLFLQKFDGIFTAILFFCIFIFSLSQGKHGFFERSLLFALFHLITFQELTELPLFYLVLFQLYGAALAFIAITILHFTEQRTACPLNIKTFKISHFIEWTHSKIYFSLLSATMGSFIFYTGIHFSIDKTYWILGTFLIVHRYDHHQTLARSFQRFIGTGLGCLVGIGLFMLIKNQIIITALIFLFSGLTPWALLKNYWLGTFFMTLMVLMLLDEVFLPTSSTELPLQRLIATLIGCLVALISILISARFKHYFQNKTSATMADGV